MSSVFRLVFICDNHILRLLSLLPIIWIMKSTIHFTFTLCSWRYCPRALVHLIFAVETSRAVLATPSPRLVISRGKSSANFPPAPRADQPDPEQTCCGDVILNKLAGVLSDKLSVKRPMEISRASFGQGDFSRNANKLDITTWKDTNLLLVYSSNLLEM